MAPERFIQHISQEFPGSFLLGGGGVYFELC